MDRLLDRPIEFGAVWPYDDGRTIVVAEFEPNERARIDEWLLLRHLWLELPPHPNLIDAIARRGGATLLVRYAALHPTSPRLALDMHAARRLVATWAVELARVFDLIHGSVGSAQFGHFLRPVVYVDLANRIRVGFLPASPKDAQIPGEDRKCWPDCEPQSAAYVIGVALVELGDRWDCDDATPLRELVDRCVDRDPNRRFDLRDIMEAFGSLAATPLRDAKLTAWQHAEEGFAWLDVGRNHAAESQFLRALEINPKLRAARQGLELVPRVREPAGHGFTRDSPWWRRDADDHPDTTWRGIAEQGHAHEAEFDHLGALRLYQCVRPTETERTALELAKARCHLALGDFGPATDFASRVLVREPDNVDAFAIVTRARLRAHKPNDALTMATRWLTVAPDDARAHYARGRALFALDRALEARDAFDRAFALSPTMLEAMLLRREADRRVRGVAASAGVARPMTLDLPERLAMLRDALAAARLDEVYPILAREDFANDATARLVHADCLAFEHRYDEAIHDYDRAAELSPDLRAKAVRGAVTALLALDRVAEAFARLEVEPSATGDVDLIELRVLALQRLQHDAEIEMRRVNAAGREPT